MSTKPALLGLALLTSACAVGEAGLPLNDQVFGYANTRNVGLSTGEIDYAVEMAQRFAQEVPDTINFEFDSAQLDAAARATLDQQAHWIRQFPEVRFRVFGHTDAVGSERYNKALGMRRARAAVNHLVSRGISRHRLEAVVSFGETQPLVLTDQRERRNRRTVTEVSGFVEGRINQLDGRYAAVIDRGYVESAVVPTTLTQTSTFAGVGE